MSVLTVIWAASLVAASFFAAAGFFAARAWSSREGRSRESEAEAQRVRLSQTELQLRQSEDRAAAALAEGERTQRALLERAETEQKAELLLEEQKRAGEEQKAEIARLQREVETLARARGDLARVEKELFAAKRRTSQLEAQKPDGDVQATKKIVELAAMVSTLRRELEGETKRTAALQADNERLRESAHQSILPKNAAETSGDPAPQAKGLDGPALQQFVDDVMRSPAISAAALTDELGFLVAGNGDHTEALAAFGAYLTEAGARACGLLPMHSVQRVSVQDDWGITLTARTVATAPNELVLVTLGVGAMPEREQSTQRERTS